MLQQIDTISISIEKAEVNLREKKQKHKPNVYEYGLEHFEEIYERKSILANSLIQEYSENVIKTLIILLVKCY